MKLLLGRPLFPAIYECKKGVEIGLPICVLCYLAKSRNVPLRSHAAGGTRRCAPCPWWLLHVPQVVAVVIAGDQPVFANLERAAEPGRRNGRRGPSAFDVVRMERRQVREMEDRAKG